MAWPVDGAPTDESGGRRAREQDCKDGLAIMVRDERYKEPKLLLVA
jgi:hypothetical protein